MICSHGRELLCKDCEREERDRIKQGIKDGTLIFGVFKWTGENRYPIENALKTYRRRADAEKYADLNELVVRTVSTRSKL